MAFVALEDWETARRAADWLLTFRYSYDVAFARDDVLGRYGFRTRGADQASPANQHLHAFGLICLPELVRLARATGDDCYRADGAREPRLLPPVRRARRTATSARRRAWRPSATTRPTASGRRACCDALARLDVGVLLYGVRGRAGARAVRRFPDGFLWGVATSAFQIEGALDADGRGRVDLGRLRRRERRHRRASPCDHYRRWRDDVELLASSASTPTASRSPGRGSSRRPRRREQRGLDHYDRLIDALLERGIEPLVTLYHWDLPQALQDEGGWRDRDTAERFAEYAAACFEAYGDRVRGG